MVAAVREVEAELASLGAATEAWRWTLTFLEGRPIVDLDDGTRIRYLPGDDRAVIMNADAGAEDDDSGKAPPN